jgi:hypothetical protein
MNGTMLLEIKKFSDKELEANLEELFNKSIADKIKNT